MEESALKRELALRGGLVKQADVKTLTSNYIAPVGNPETAIGTLEEAHDVPDFEHLVMYVHVGGLSNEFSRANIRRPATEVIPQFRNRKSKRVG